MQLPRNCRTFIAIAPIAQWGWSEIFANKMVHLLEVLAWQKTKDAQKKVPQNKPKPFIPDFMRSHMATNEEVEARPIDDMREILAKPRKEV